MRVLVALLFLISLICSIVNCHIGVDVAYGTSVSDFKCLKSKKYSRAIVRCYQSIGQIDPNCIPSINNAKKAGIELVDVYLFPKSSISASKQVEDTLNHLSSFIDKKEIGYIWLDIEAPNLWSSNHDSNRKFIQELIDTASKNKNIKTGIYTSESQWEPIVGNWDGGKHQDLWYAHYDNSKSFSDFEAFGGWSHPYMKQYAGNINECGMGIDKNYWV